MSGAQQWFLIGLWNVFVWSVLIARFTNWYERPPLAWLVNANRWLADRLVRPWLDPVLRKLGVEP